MTEYNSLSDFVTSTRENITMPDTTTVALNAAEVMETLTDEQRDAISTAVLDAMKRSFAAGTTWGFEYATSTDEDETNSAFGMYLLAGLVNATSGGVSA